MHDGAAGVGMAGEEDFVDTSTDGVDAGLMGGIEDLENVLGQSRGGEQTGKGARGVLAAGRWF
jgi:hypothetical protein